MDLRPIHDVEKKKGGHSGLLHSATAERIQQACPLFFAALQTRFFNGVPMGTKMKNYFSPPSWNQTRTA